MQKSLLRCAHAAQFRVKQKPMNSTSALRRSSLPTFFTLLLFALHARPAPAQAVPRFVSPAAARAWGEARERAGQYQSAGLAYAQEAALYDRRGDPQAAEAERRRARRLLSDLAVAVSVPLAAPARLAKLEPLAGCLLGALDQTPDGRLGNADDLARRLGRPLGVAFNYARYGEPFPLDWARAQARRGRMVQIAWEPQGGLASVQDDAYLNRWVQDASRCGTGVFLRFAGEMNGGWTRWGRNPAAYKRAFRLVHSVVARTAPNIALVWAPNAVPFSGVDAYYPGDDAVDWVGLSLYLVRFYDDNLRRPAWRDGSQGFIDPFYAKYAARKPLCLVECGISRRARVENADADEFASARIADLLDALRVRYPRLKMACWFDRDNLTGATPARRLNDYSLPRGSRALAALQDAVADPYFLGSTQARAPLAYARIAGRLPARYAGPLLFSLSTYALDPVIVAVQGGAQARLVRPYRYFATPGRGPLRLRVVDQQGRVAASALIAAP